MVLWLVGLIRWWMRRRGFTWFDMYHGGEWRRTDNK